VRLDGTDEGTTEPLDCASLMMSYVMIGDTIGRVRERAIFLRITDILIFIYYYR
jgi:hypothetical protein